MKVLRDNKDSLMAVLEAFVYDPLINWRLMQADPETRPPDGIFLVVSAEVSPPTNPCDCVAELRSQELTRVAGYPQGPLRKLKADENDIFNG
jgi:FKBP12-rapamycin complex-associated protein